MLAMAAISRHTRHETLLMVSGAKPSLNLWSFSLRQGRLGPKCACSAVVAGLMTHLKGVHDDLPNLSRFSCNHGRTALVLAEVFTNE